MTIFKLIKYFIQKYGRSPSPSELYKLQQKAKNIAEQNKVIQFPPGGKDKTDPFKPRPETGGSVEGIMQRAEKMKKLAAELAEMQKNKPSFAESYFGMGKAKPKSEGIPTTTKGEVKTKFENELGIKLYGDETYGELMEIKNTGKHPRDKADGGRIGFKVGGILDLLKLIKGKYGKKAITTADKIKRPKSALDRDMFKDFNQRINKDDSRQLTELEMDDFVDELGGGDNLEAYSFDGTAGDSKRILKEQKDYMDEMYDMYKTGKLDPESGSVSRARLNLLRQRAEEAEMTKDYRLFGEDEIAEKNYLEEYFEKDYLDFKAQQTDRKMTQEEINRLKDLSDKGFADGGLAHMLGEPRSEYSGGGAGMPPVTHDDNVDDIGPGHKSGSVFNTPQIDPRIFNQNRGSGIMIHPRALGNMQPQTQGLAHGGRTGFKEGGMNRRGFLKLAAGLASLPIIGKYFKAAKVASKIKVLGNTTTTMPAWFPDLVDKFMIKGIGKKIDADLMEYTVKDLPGVKLAKHDDGKLLLEGKNEYGKPYAIEYEPPGYELIDETTGKAVKTKGDFRATDSVPEMSQPDDVPDFFPEQLDDVGEILGSDARVLEEFATGKKIKGLTKGENSLVQAENRLESGLDDIDDFATGGLARLLGE